MKHLFILICLFVFLSCQKDKDLIVGEWEQVKTVDCEGNETITQSTRIYNSDWTCELVQVDPNVQSIFFDWKQKGNKLCRTQDDQKTVCDQFSVDETELIITIDDDCSRTMTFKRN